MKYNFLALLLAGTFLTSAVCAAPDVLLEPNAPATQEEMLKQRMENRAEEMSKKIAEDLNLTEEQKIQAKQIREDGKKEIKPLMEQMSALRKEIDAKRHANMQAFEKILTPDQLKKFEELKQQGKERAHHKMMQGMHHFDKHHAKPAEIAPENAAK